MNDTLKGKVTKDLFAKGSKSESVGYFLETPEQTYKLVRQGTNPFEDDLELAKLLGKQIEAKGHVHRSQFILTNWAIL